jgi:tetraacyldisaccharide 4'-kinase
MKAPEFWRQDGVLARMLSPLSLLYTIAGRLRRRFAVAESVGVPVICVGNLTAGGSGKTPVALMIATHLKARGFNPHFLSRGYGGRHAGPLKVDPGRHDAAAVGDEPLLLAARAPAWVARDRLAGARAAVAGGADAIVMDDGFQNPYLHKNWSVLVVDGGFGFGNGRVHPAGPLREPVADGLGRADAVVVIDTDEGASALATDFGGVPSVRARLVPDEKAIALRGQPVLAFAGIGRPEKFFATVRSLGAELVGQQAFADHYRYRADEIMALIDRAHAHGARAVTTAKDAQRLPPDAIPMIDIVNVSLALDDDLFLTTHLDPVLKGHAGD